MSLKSFDKFCEKIIKGERIDNKDIFDERQERVRTKILVQSLVCFGSLSAANALLMECGVLWSESCFMPTAVFMAVCYLGFLLQNARHGSLFGVKGTAKAAAGAWAMLVQGILLLIVFLNDDDVSFYVIKNGMLSEAFLIVIFFALVIAAGVITIVLARKYNKNNMPR